LKRAALFSKSRISKTTPSIGAQVYQGSNRKELHDHSGIMTPVIWLMSWLLYPKTKENWLLLMDYSAWRERMHLCLKSFLGAGSMGRA
jgi:hypothetical protein